MPVWLREFLGTVWPEEPIGVAVAVLPFISPVLATLAIVVARESRKVATRAAADARKGSQASLVIHLFDAYNEPEMQEAMVFLRAYKTKHPVFTSDFRREVQSEFGEVSPANAARRLVSTHFEKVWAVSRCEFLTPEQLDLCMTKKQVEFYRDVVEPLEAALDIGYCRDSFDGFGSRHGVEPSPFIALMDGWTSEKEGERSAETE